MKKVFLIGLLISLVLSACGLNNPQVEEGNGENQQIVVYAEDG